MAHTSFNDPSEPIRRILSRAICEISPEQVPISTCAINYRLHKPEGSEVRQILDPETIGNGWGKAAGSPEHIWAETDERVCLMYRLVGGKLLMLQHPLLEADDQKTEDMLRLFTVPQEGETFVAVRKYAHQPDITSAAINVYIASAYTIESPEVKMVRSDGWSTPAEAIDALLLDVEHKILLMTLPGKHDALDSNQIAKALPSIYKDIRTHREYVENSEPAAFPQGLSKTGIEYHGNAMDGPSNTVPTMGLHQASPTNSQSVDPVVPLPNPFQEGGMSGMWSGANTNGSLLGNGNIHVDAHLGWAQANNHFQLDHQGLLDNQGQQPQQYQQPLPYQQSLPFHQPQPYHQPQQYPQPPQLQQPLQYQQPQPYQQPLPHYQPQQFQQGQQDHQPLDPLQSQGKPTFAYPPSLT